MVRRTRMAALLTLAMINVFTLVAGIAVAVMLPARLAALRIPTVAAGRVTSAGTVLAAGVSGQMPSAGGLRAALSGPLSSAALGSRVLAIVADPGTGQVLFSQGGSETATPASTTKLATAVAALAVLGDRYRFTTKVVMGSGGIVLVGGGDPTLAVNAYPAQDYPKPATLSALAAATAAALKAQGRTSVRLGFDTSLYSGPGMATAWPDAYVTSGNVTPIVALEVDQGRLTSSGAPEDSDDPYNLSPRTAHPAIMATAAFASLLRADGITVTSVGGEERAPAGGTVLASVSSPPVSAITEQMLAESNNVIAENLARRVAIASGLPGSFSGAAAGVIGALRRLGDDGAISLVDGSGLSPKDAIAPATLVKVIEVAMVTPRLRAALAALPVAGFSGTLAAGESVFAGIGGQALGSVRAKTGNLGTVAALSGLAYDKDGALLVFAFMADGVPKAALLDQAAGAINAAAARLAGCGCR